MPKSVADVRTRFTAQLTSLKKAAAAAFAATKMTAPREWFSPDKGDWDGDLTNVEGLSKAYDRSDNATDFQAAIKDGRQPGTVGDLLASQIQGDYLAVQERAYRARMHSSVRCRFHAAARQRGHGDEKGLFQQGVLGYVAQLVKASKAG